MPNVGMIAINDAFMLESSIYLLLKKYFKQEKCYVDLMELFHEVSFQTELGQACDLLTAPEEHVDLDNFSLEKYTFIVIYKTAYYSFYLPVALALHFTGFATPKNLRIAEDILIPMASTSKCKTTTSTTSPTPPCWARSAPTSRTTSAAG
ncbi:Farnesyl pyrophosphate synthase [Hortaea werneckii EXF-2000]|uniref:Farnesyl pyrophosphate synthase n=1 Tax=Hortaea werneckii EXF-2000 TaxID=1157616 RepID=A0A1Z5SQD9_HORWE|nr:Farnesyl pyrophosphate synthase [Hortaea werneckii EXF-2000]